MADELTDYEKKYQEELERAQALSLESLALEQFKNKRLQELNKLLTNTTKTKNISVSRTSSLTETDGVPRYDRNSSKSRPRPGTATISQSKSLIAPPPASQRKLSCPSTVSESPDLISFSSPPPANNTLEFYNFHKLSNTASSPTIPVPQQPPPPYCTYPRMPSYMGGPFSMVSQQQRPIGWQVPSFPRPGSTATSSQSLPPSIGGHVSPMMGSSPLGGASLSSSPSLGQLQLSRDANAPDREKGAETPQNEKPPALPPKSQIRQPPPIIVPSRSASISLKNKVSVPKRPESGVTRRSENNLIDLAQSSLDDKNSVRVSILQEFDPILTSTELASLRAVSPECQDDTVSVTDSVYSEYEPYDFIYSGSGSNSLSDPLYAAIVKSEIVQQSSPPPVPPRVKISTLERRSKSREMKTKLSLLDSVTERGDSKSNQSRDADLIAFYKMVLNLRSRHPYNEPDTNMGLVISPMVNYDYKEGTSIKLCVHPDFEGADFNKPISFTCDVTTSVEHATLQLTYELDAPPDEQYTLKVWGYNEYLVPTTFLSDYEYIHNCIKLEEDVLLILIPDSKVDKSFARTLQDDNRDKELTFDNIIPNECVSLVISHEKLRILLETVEDEMKKLEDVAVQIEQTQSSPGTHPLQYSKVIQSVKYIINLMGNLCTLDIMESIEGLSCVCKDYISYRTTVSLSKNISSSCNKIRLAVQNLIEMYCQAFKVDFDITNPIASLEPKKYVNCVNDFVVLRLCAIYRPLPDWKYENYTVAAQIYHGTRPFGHPVLSHPSEKIEQNQQWPSRIVFDDWFQLEDVPISVLARESRLVLVVYGSTLENPDSTSDPPQYKKEEIGWSSVQFFDYGGNMIQGGYLLSVWPKETNFIYGPAPSSGTHPHSEHPMIGVEVTGAVNATFPPPPSAPVTQIIRGDFNSLDKQTQEQLMGICERDIFTKTLPEDREVLWEKRHYLLGIPRALPKVLLAANNWDYASLPDLYGMIESWQSLQPIEALQLLLPTFPDIKVRRTAVKWISKMSNDELVDYLPQLVVALRHETFENSSLAQFLLDRALTSPRVAHHLFWLLSHSLPGSSPQNFNQEEKDPLEISQVRYHRRMKLILRALFAICGEALRKCFLSQQLLVKELNDIAETVQKTKESHRLTILQNSLELVNNILQENPTSLPLSPTLRVAGVQTETCTYFPSYTLPLKINFKAPDSSIIPAIYKAGDDLQQDMLTLQMVRVMDKLWLKAGLDLKMVAFTCVPTGKKKGMIEMVVKAETLRKIQVEHGLTGSFKDKPIAEWLAKHNPSELEYGRAVENFTASCAGYCVVTYVLGICDRHNDNIMLKTSGHLFHIDFGKFLGDAQMFGNFKRDRAPFVLTSDMAYVINGGDRPSEKFHKFVDLCCQAFNIIRNNGDLFLYLFTLMASSGICGVTYQSVNYLHNALLPGLSNPEAAAHFARLIECSLKSWFTQFNFFLHNLAQLKFSAEHTDGSLLSFVPKKYSVETDGRLTQVDVVSYRKRYDPDKYYVYILRVYREDRGEPMEIQRTYKEFCELHQKLCIYFPLAKLHSLSNGLHVGRSNIKQVAEKRYGEVSLFIKSLFLCADEIAHSDLVYTFFHPLLRDQQYPDDFSRKSKDRKSEPRGESGRLNGQLKLSMTFGKGVFRVMVHHVRGLAPLANGQEPSCYVKVYLKPDSNKATKRKTKVVKKNCHPSFMEMLEYRMTLDVVKSRRLQATVWNYDALQENEFLGGVELELALFDLNEEITEWYPLTNISR